MYNVKVGSVTHYYWYYIIKDWSRRLNLEFCWQIDRINLMLFCVTALKQSCRAQPVHKIQYTVIPLFYAPLLYAYLYYTRFLSKSLVLSNTSITRQITSILRGPILYAVFSLKSGTPDYRLLRIIEVWLYNHQLNLLLKYWVLAWSIKLSKHEHASTQHTALCFKCQNQKYSCNFTDCDYKVNKSVNTNTNTCGLKLETFLLTIQS